ncbi:hypothetical protein PENANT_c017G10259 [Penicillium antarcticum]|uniref:Uncharacterized protein n=1 Tax=Penicillium antarcticum TaxID=416450 RepID=A0A1V6Q225_9EURO|nr:hypothetical protein PENANT_c017G10259 [Penicillium antarcticum]
MTFLCDDMNFSFSSTKVSPTKSIITFMSTWHLKGSFHKATAL